MIVEDFVRVVDDEQKLCIDVMIQDDVDGETQTYSMEWTGIAADVPLRVMKTSINKIGVYYDDDCCLCNCLEIFSEE